MQPAKTLAKAFSVLIVLTLAVGGCNDVCNSTQTYVQYAPVYATMENFRDSIRVVSAREINRPGRIYFKDGFLLINEIGEGFHVIDNRNPYDPVTLSFIEVPGNFDLAAQGNHLYADSFIDLVVFDISDMTHIHEVGREEEVFLESYWNNGTWDSERGLLVRYDEEIITEKVDCEPVNSCPGCFIFPLGGGRAVDDIAFAEPAANFNFETSGATTGVGGSMARFTITSGHLFTLDHFSLRSFDLSNELAPELQSQVDISWGMETIFPYGDHLFLGAMDGMWIYDITNPAQPVHTSNVNHIRSCDPVVVKDNYAYVTLRGGNACGGFTDQLDIYDISDIRNPNLVTTVPMDNPHGLGIDGNCLFICEGDYGLKWYDASNVMDLELMHHYKDIHALDVIPLNNNLMMIGNDGLYQYNYFCGIDEIQLMSSIPIEFQ